MTPTLSAYAAYILLSIGLTIWVARTLHRNGRLFLVDVFDGNAQLARFAHENCVRVRPDAVSARKSRSERGSGSLDPLSTLSLDREADALDQRAADAAEATAGRARA